jgi:RimJ/RimL family protein N-acetyltransferase
MAMSEFYTIHTERLVLRTPQVRDAAAYVHLNTNPENQLFDPSPPDSEDRAHTIEKFESSITKWREATAKGEAAFMVVTLPGRLDKDGTPHDKTQLSTSHEIEGDTVIGMTGFNELKRRTRPSQIDGNNEEYFEGNIGVLIDAPKYTNKGYAKEALKAIIEYGFSTMGCDVLSAETLAENKPFRALMSSLGLGAGEEVDGRDRWGKTVTEAVYRINKKDWMVISR